MGWATATTRLAGNLQGHHYTGAIGYFDFETYDDVGPGASIAVTDYNHGTPGLRGGGMLANEFIRLPIHMVDRLPDGTPRWGLAHKQAMRAWHKRSIVIMGPTQQIPIAAARVSVDPDGARQVGTAGGAHFEGNVHPHTYDIGDSAGEAGRSMAQGSGRDPHFAHVLPVSETVERGPAPGRDLPHGRRSPRLGGQQAPARCTTSTTSS